MKIKTGISLNLKQKLSLQKVAVVTSIAFAVAILTVVFFQLKNPERTIAATCDSSYTLNWSDPSTYTVTCGSVNASNWSVKGFTCFYNSPTFNAGGTVGEPSKVADVTVRINQSGNLDGNDTAWVYMYANNVIVNTFTCVGDSTSAVFSTSLSIPVPAGGTYKIVAKLKNDKSNETWQIKNGDVTSCLRTITPLPINLAGFTGQMNSSRGVDLKWITYSEIDNDYFTLERSATGEHFEPIAQIDGAGSSNSTKKYFYTDTKPFTGINYYRLTQTDFDGTTTDSYVIKINNNSQNPKLAEVLVYPNPFKSNFSVKYVAEQTQEIIVRLVTMDGLVLYSEKHQAIEGSNNFMCKVATEIKSGKYVVQLVGNDKLIGTAKVVCR